MSPSVSHIKVQPVLVAHHSHLWIRVAVESYLEQFPGESILVVDNNPRRGEPGYVPNCALERAWLAAHPAVILIDNPFPLSPWGLRCHGSGMDTAVHWCRNQNIPIMLHFEPDCVVSGRDWRDNLVAAIDKGAWMSGGYRQSHGTIHPVPSAWRVDEVRTSFKTARWEGNGIDHPRFRELIRPEALEHDPTPEGIWIRALRVWDTAHRAWFEAAVNDQAALVPIPGITHYWHGSWGEKFREETFCARYPQGRPFLERARAYLPQRTASRCPYRAQARPEEIVCDLLQLSSGVANRDLCLVPINACDTCCASYPPTLDLPNPIVASLTYRLAEMIIDAGGVTGCDVAKAERLRSGVEPDLDVELP